MSDRSLEDLHFLDIILALLGGESESVERALPVLDIDRFRHWCLRQQLGGLAYLLLEDMSLRVSPPRALLVGLRGTYLEQWARTERLRLNLAWTARILGEAGEDFLVLKGLPFAQKYDGSNHRRATGDLDLWVRRAHAPRVADTLEKSGLKRVSPRYAEGSAAFDRLHEVELDLEGTSVELHHALRVHPTFSIAEDAVWADRLAVEIQGDSYSTLSNEHALLLHLLGFHTDVQIGQTNARWFADLHQMLLVLEPGIDWDAFFAARDRDGTRKICVNSLAVFLVLTRRDDSFPRLSAALERRRGDIVLEPDRFAYLDLLRGASMLDRKTWPLRQYEGGMPSALGWWLSGMPRRIAAKPAAFADDVASHAAETSPWEGAGGPRGGSTLSDEFGVEPATLQEAQLPFGSLRAIVRYERASDLDAVRELFRLRPGASGSARSGDVPGEPVGAVIYIFPRSGAQLALMRRPGRPIVAHPLERVLEIHEGIVHAWIYLRTPLEAYLAIDRGHETRPLLLHSLMVVLNKFLALQGRYHLHAAAVGLQGSTALFVGEKGSGKSTISLTLGRIGATVFSEDHVMLRQQGNSFFVSGCDGDMHLTAKSEQHFFDRPLDGRLVRRAGVAKKQIDMASVLNCQPYQETEVASIFFCTVGARFDIRPLAKQEAVARILGPLTERHRFADEDEQRGFLEVFAKLVELRETYELSLSPDLGELSRLVDFLSAPNAGATRDKAGTDATAGSSIARDRG